MNGIDINRLMAEISREAPSGEKDLEYDPAFVALEKAAQGTPEHEFNGKIIQEAKPPNWIMVRDAGIELLTRTHDLRVAMHLIRAMLHTEGFSGLRAGLELLHGFVSQYWETVYPMLAPEDNNDPTIRINILAGLCERADIIVPLMKTTLCASPTLGQFNLRDIQIASGKIEPTKNDKSPAPTKAIIDAAFMNSNVAELEKTRQEIKASLDNLNRLEAALAEKTGGSGSGYDFGDLMKVLKEIGDVLEKELVGRVGSGPSESQTTSGLSDQKPPDAASGYAEKPIGMITTRQDVIRVLDQICVYYQQYEPGSPVPLLLKRARRLVDKDFIEILTDLGLESGAQIKTLFSGAEDDKKP